MTQETQDKETFSAGPRSRNTPLREPAEKEPFVETLYDKQTYQGSRAELEVEYEASSAVDIQWKRNGYNYVSFDGRRSTGKTSMVIEKADVALHNNKTYTVVITDNKKRRCLTSATVFVD